MNTTIVPAVYQLFIGYCQFSRSLRYRCFDPRLVQISSRPGGRTT